MTRLSNALGWCFWPSNLTSFQRFWTESPGMSLRNTSSFPWQLESLLKHLRRWGFIITQVSLTSENIRYHSAVCLSSCCLLGHAWFAWCQIFPVCSWKARCSSPQARVLERRRRLSWRPSSARVDWWRRGLSPGLTPTRAWVAAASRLWVAAASYLWIRIFCKLHTNYLNELCRGFQNGVCGNI